MTTYSHLTNRKDKSIMKHSMKLVFLIIGFVYITWLLANVAGAQDAPVQVDETCPAGTYSIGYDKDGEILCKLEPAGCPYVESLPEGPECDKLAPDYTEVLGEVKEAPVRPQTPTSSK